MFTWWLSVYFAVRIPEKIAITYVYLMVEGLFCGQDLGKNRYFICLLWWLNVYFAASEKNRYYIMFTWWLNVYFSASEKIVITYVSLIVQCLLCGTLLFYVVSPSSLRIKTRRRQLQVAICHLQMIREDKFYW